LRVLGKSAEAVHWRRFDGERKKHDAKTQTRGRRRE
jgi:hypothetical protein